jgi:transposase
VLLLDVPKRRIVNDAARAKNRVVDLDIKAVTPETLTKLLGLPGMRVEGFAVEEQKGQEYLHLFGEHCHEVAICPRCGEVMVGSYDSEQRSVRHLDIWGMRTIIHFSRRRFDCTVCGKPFTEVLDWIDPKRRQTLAFEQYIYSTFAQIWT